jgi:hypothetical protein
MTPDHPLQAARGIGLAAILGAAMWVVVGVGAALVEWLL